MATAAQRESGLVHGLTEDEIDHELLKCSMSVEYFINTYVKIKHQRRWVPFKLWPKQVEALRAMMAHKKLVVLKCRQVGVSWLALAKSLWRLVFRPGSAALILSLREEEALALVRMRLKPMFDRLPPWMRPDATSEGVKHWTLATGEDEPSHNNPAVEGVPALPQDGPKIHSVCVALPSNRGDSYVADDVLVDEADLIRKLGPLLESLEPTVEDNPDASLTLISRVDKSNPGSTFQNICQAALDGESDYRLAFIGVFDHPDRTPEWYDGLCKAAMRKHGSLDSVHAAYPRTPEEALKPKAQGKRIPPEWLAKVYEHRQPTPLGEVDGAPAMVGLRLYTAPVPGVRYVIGADVAEGVGGDDSAAVVARHDNGKVVAVLAGQFEPKLQYPTMLRTLSRYYNDAPCMPERNSIGVAVLAKLQEFRVAVLTGYDGKPGWLTTNTATGINASKVEMWTRAALAVKQDDCAIYDQRLYFQVGAIDAGTLAHPSKKSGAKRVDDEAMAFALAMAARAQPSKTAWLKAFTRS